jgi:radical SAM protein with 4Fe4S-binding SPASM domain
VVGNVQTLVDLERTLDRATPRVSIWFTAMRLNLEELPAFVRLAEKIGVPEVYVQRLVFYGQGLAVQEQSLHRSLEQREQQLIEEALRLARTAGIALRASGLTAPLESLTGTAPDKRPWSGCQRPWTLSYVTANGNVLPCCIAPWVAKDYSGAILGNAFEQGFADVWNGERYQRFRADFESDTAPDPCRGCGRLWSI